MRNTMGALVLTLFATIVASCDRTVAPEAPGIRRDSAVANAMPVDIDIYNCWRYENEDKWRCNKVGSTTFWAGDYWGSDRFWTNKDCVNNRSHAVYCTNEFRHNSGYTTRPNPGPTGGSSDSERIPKPTCPQPEGSVDTLALMYCAGKPPDTIQRERIRAALDRISAKGGACTELANLGYALMGRSDAIHVFPQSSFYNKMGGAPKDGGGSGPYSYMSLSSLFADEFYDAAHAAEGTASDGHRYRVTLQTVLAHELDHLKGKDHIVVAGVMKELETLNTRLCSDVDIGPI